MFFRLLARKLRNNIVSYFLFFQIFSKIIPTVVLSLLATGLFVKVAFPPQRYKKGRKNPPFFVFIKFQFPLKEVLW